MIADIVMRCSQDPDFLITDAAVNSRAQHQLVHQHQQSLDQEEEEANKKSCSIDSSRKEEEEDQKQQGLHATTDAVGQQQTSPAAPAVHPHHPHPHQHLVQCLISSEKMSELRDLLIKKEGKLNSSAIQLQITAQSSLKSASSAHHHASAMHHHHHHHHQSSSSSSKGQLVASATGHGHALRHQHPHPVATGSSHLHHHSCSSSPTTTTTTTTTTAAMSRDATRTPSPAGAGGALLLCQPEANSIRILCRRWSCVQQRKRKQDLECASPQCLISSSSSSLGLGFLGKWAFLGRVFPKTTLWSP